MFCLGELVWINSNEPSCKKEGWGLIVGIKKVKLDDCYMEDWIVYKDGRKIHLSSAHMTAFKFMNKHLGGLDYGNT